MPTTLLPTGDCHPAVRTAAVDRTIPQGFGLVGANDMFASLRVLIAHDWLVTWAGSERCVEQLLALFPNADLVVGLKSPSIAEYNDTTRRARETWLGRLPGARSHHRWTLPLEGLAFGSLDTSAYDLVISSAHAFSKCVRRRPGAVHVCYCYTPPRYLWDLRATYLGHARPLEQLALKCATGVLRRLDRSAAQGVDHFVCIANSIVHRIRRCYDRDAQVVHPPVSRKPLKTPVLARGDFLLSLGRLVPYKRVDLAIQAAERLGIRIIVAGDGPERKKLESVAGPYTEFVGEVSEEQAAQLLSSCAAFVFCADEDFGIAPVEANAHGAPVVGLGRGGLLETMREHATAEFFLDDTPASVAFAVGRALERRWDEGTLRANAERFSPEAFRRNMTTTLVGILNGKPAHTSNT